jgi:hypothetical protein
MTQKCTRNPIPSSKHKGNGAIKFIIIVVLVVCVVWVVNSMEKDPSGPVEQCPWVEADRIVNDISAINLPQSPQISMDKVKGISQKITSEDGQDRGRLLVEIDPEGLVGATWKATYKEGSYEKQFTASCAGNIDAEKLYEDENDVDPSKLFFITKGNFQLRAFQQGNARAGGGDAYIVGWISPDGTATGTLVLAPDKKKTKIYKWGN